jgi:hypothetical protein
MWKSADLLSWKALIWKKVFIDTGPEKGLQTLWTAQEHFEDYSKSTSLIKVGR